MIIPEDFLNFIKNNSKKNFDEIIKSKLNKEIPFNIVEERIIKVIKELIVSVSYKGYGGLKLSISSYFTQRIDYIPESFFSSSIETETETGTNKKIEEVNKVKNNKNNLEIKDIDLDKEVVILSTLNYTPYRESLKTINLRFNPDSFSQILSSQIISKNNISKEEIYNGLLEAEKRELLFNKEIKVQINLEKILAYFIDLGFKIEITKDDEIIIQWENSIKLYISIFYLSLVYFNYTTKTDIPEIDSSLTENELEQIHVNINNKLEHFSKSNKFLDLDTNLLDLLDKVNQENIFSYNIIR